MNNKAKNTAIPTNKQYSSQGITWDEATFTWDDAQGTWDNPYNITNKEKNTATMTNLAKS